MCIRDRYNVTQSLLVGFLFRGLLLYSSWGKEQILYCSWGLHAPPPHGYHAIDRLTYYTRASKLYTTEISAMMKKSFEVANTMLPRSKHWVSLIHVCTMCQFYSNKCMHACPLADLQYVLIRLVPIMLIFLPIILFYYTPTGTDYSKEICLLFSIRDILFWSEYIDTLW